MKKMNPEAKQAWLSALRSGEFAQAHQVLTRLDDNGDVIGHCCLGVLCEVAIEKGLDLSLGTGAFNHGEARFYDGIAAYLPDSVAKWAGVHSRGVLTSDINLARMNDGGATFEQIADVIEREL